MLKGQGHGYDDELIVLLISLRYVFLSFSSDRCGNAELLTVASLQLCGDSKWLQCIVKHGLFCLDAASPFTLSDFFYRFTKKYIKFNYIYIYIYMEQ